jgi:hypothetical protein
MNTAAIPAGAAAMIRSMNNGTVLNVIKCDTSSNVFLPQTPGNTVANNSTMEINTVTGEVGDVTSSIRYKKNIFDYVPDPNNFFQLRVVSFDWKDGSGTGEIGLLAEEVAALYPHTARYEREAIYETVPSPGDPNETETVVARYEAIDVIRSYNERDLIPIIISAMQEMQTEIDSLKARVEVLEDGE